ncbi:MAG: NADH dehydrogenase ubiquinone Fe-S protein 4 [Maricaulaceae bacterium]
MFARIYQSTPSTMQSGRASSGQWVLDFVSSAAKTVDPLTGNVRSTDMRKQLDLKFATREEAVAYAKAHNIPHRVSAEKTVKRVSRSYASNFDYDRKLPWTH